MDQDRSVSGVVEAVCRVLLEDTLTQAVRRQLDLPLKPGLTVEEKTFLDSLWKAFRKWAKDDEKSFQRVTRILRHAIEGVIASSSCPPAGQDVQATGERCGLGRQRRRHAEYTEAGRR